MILVLFVLHVRVRYVPGTQSATIVEHKGAWIEQKEGDRK